MSNIIEQIPGFNDDQLQALRKNAERLSGDGKPAQRATAQAVLEAADAEIEIRAVARKKEMAERLAQRLAAKPKTSRAKKKVPASA